MSWLALSLACHITPAQRDWRKKDWVDLDASYEWTCGVHADGRIQCWGGSGSDTDDGYDLSPPEEGSYTEVALAESQYACALEDDGSVTCWGDDLYIPTGNPGGTFSGIACGSVLCCGTLEGDAACWGALGSNETIALGRSYEKIRVAGGTACGLKGGGKIECWSTSDLAVDETYVVFEGAGYIDLDAYGDAVCAVVEGTGAIECEGTSGGSSGWGAEDLGEGWSQVAVATNAVCGIDEDGAVSCLEGGLDAPPEDVRFAELDGGNGYACGVTTEGGAWCWGNEYVDEAYLHP